jgi:hypothetical protein
LTCSAFVRAATSIVRQHDLEPDHGGQHRFLRMHQAVAALQYDDGALGGIAGGVMLE